MLFHESRDKWLQQAQALRPVLQEEAKQPQQAIRVVPNAAAFQGWQTTSDGPISTVEGRAWGRNESFILDFEAYLVGYFEFSLAVVGTMDAPVRLKFTFGEMPAEVAESFDPFESDLSRAWLQDEIITPDVLPQTVRLPRRYAFRFLKIEVIDTSRSFQVQFSNFLCHKVTSADFKRVAVLPIGLSERAQQLDDISITTLASCMHTVFEDGPKRDRRLWIGDLRVQALANTETFGNYDLVKRCLYLFAALAHENGLVPACVFEAPQPHRGHCDILDYTALYVPTLLEYAHASGDWETARDLWPVAQRQMEGVLEYVNADGLFIDPTTWWIFIDWQNVLNKQTAMHGVAVYCLRRGIEMAQHLGFEEQAAAWQLVLDKMVSAAREKLLSHQGLFVSGGENQVSWASQVWMILAQVVSPGQGAEILQAVQRHHDAVRPAGPYLYHYVVEAMLHCGLNDEARDLLYSYWGGMAERGAKTFWEVFDPQNPLLSPYHNHLINSYCHAWSCTPTYFVRRHPDLFRETTEAPKGG